jgi:hypothetical protein
MREAKTKTIGAHTYEVRQLGGLEARKMLVRLAKMLGGVFGGDIAAGIASLSEEDSEYLFNTMSQHTCVRVSKDQAPELYRIFDEHFSGRTFEMMQWLVFALEVNFPDFLERLRSIPALQNVVSPATKKASD